MKRFHALLFGVILCLSAQAALTQPALTPITPENAAQIEQIERLGNGVVRELSLSADGERVAAATALGVWEVDLDGDATRARHAVPLLEGQGGASSVAFSPDGSMIASGGDDGSVMVWDAASGEAIERLTHHLYPVGAVEWAGKLIASGDASGMVRLWDTTTWSEYRVFQGTGSVTALRFDSAITQLTAQGGDTITVWDIARSAVLSQHTGSLGLDNPLDVRADTRRVDYAAETGQIRIWDKGVLSASFDQFYDELGDVFFTADGRVGAEGKAPLHLWSLDGDDSDAPPPVISPDGTREATFGNDGVIRLHDRTTGSTIAALYGHIRAINAVAFSPDGRLLASASNDGTIQVWDASVTQDSGSLVVLRGHTSGVSDVAFNPDGSLIASAGFDGTIWLWGVRG